MRSSDRLSDVTLYLVTDTTPAIGSVEDFLALVIGAGVRMVQLRERRLDDRALCEAARIFARSCKVHGALFIVNDRADIALAVEADGVHVGQDDLHPDVARAIVGGDRIVGFSTHSAGQIDAAAETAADYIGVGPVYETPTKAGRAAVGLDLVRYAAAHSSKPFFAIGGIDADNARAVVDAGARALSVVRAVTQSMHPDRAVRALIDAIGPRPAEAPSRMTGR